MHADLEPGAAHADERRRAPRADVGPGQQRTVEERAQAVVLDHRRARHLPHEAAPEDATDRAAGVIRSEAEEERRVRAVALQEPDDARHALARAAVGVDVCRQRALRGWGVSTRRREAAE